ncbi:MAG TPA: hypothetical protein VF733_00480 [Candidatus Saccharimonadales bacterium]
MSGECVIAGEGPVLWNPLAESAPRAMGPGLGEQAIPKLGAFGTCGNPNDPNFSSWRLQHLFPIAKMYGIEETDIFNPEVTEWRPEMAQLESYHFARDEVVVIKITDATDSPASITEAGFGVFGGMLRGQDVIVSIDLTKQSPERTRIARHLARGILDPISDLSASFSLVEDTEVVCHMAAVKFLERQKQRKAGLKPRVGYLPPSRRNLAPAVFLSGTCGEVKPEWMHAVADTIQSNGVPVQDAYSENWSIGAQSEEWTHKINDAVQLIAITGETESLGALAELGPRMMNAYLTGQSLGVFIGDHPSGPKSPTNRTRTLAKAHLGRLLEDFPDLPIFIAKDLYQLALFGTVEYLKQRQRLEWANGR